MKNVEIKATVSYEHQQAIRDRIVGYHGAIFKGTDNQKDTYFKVPHGRLKVREGNIEKYLVQYFRPDQGGPKLSKCEIVPCPNPEATARALEKALGILTVVEKSRDIFYIGNVKIHLDHVQSLGFFVEIEAQDYDDTKDEDGLRSQCQALMADIKLRDEQLIVSSYSDMMIGRGECGFDKPWVGKCTNPKLQGSSRCKEHQEKCFKCGREADTHCDSSVFGLMCGTPVCLYHKYDHNHGAVDPELVTQVIEPYKEKLRAEGWKGD